VLGQITPASNSSWIIFQFHSFVQNGSRKDAKWLVDYVESMEYHDHDHLMKGVSHGVSETLVDAYSISIVNQDGSLMVGCQQLGWH
jgi:hypothetical protein